MKNRTGEKYVTNECYEIEIIEYFRNDNCTILFDDGVILKNMSYKEIKLGNIKNNNHKSVRGIGFIGYGKYKTKNKNIDDLAYIYWSSMFNRCYGEKYKEKYPSYKNCSVHSEWHNFQNFAEWFYNYYNPLFMTGWQLDKDILVKGNKIYSSKTCSLVPREINNLISINKSFRNNLPVGVHKQKNRFIAQYRCNGKPMYLGMFIDKIDAFYAYKKGKENHIFSTAIKYKDFITSDVFIALINYKININD